MYLDKKINCSNRADVESANSDEVVLNGLRSIKYWAISDALYNKKGIKKNIANTIFFLSTNSTYKEKIIPAPIIPARDCEANTADINNKIAIFEERIKEKETSIEDIKKRIEDISKEMGNE